MARTEKLRWEDVLLAAEDVFNIWVGRPEMKWAKTAWGHILKAGLADYANELEYCKVCVRFLALADIYYDWCSIAWGEDRSDEPILDASEYFEMRPFRLGQLIGAENLLEGYIFPEKIEKDAVCTLVGAARSEVFEAILRGFGGVEELFVSLFNSKESRKKAMISGAWELNYVEFSLCDAYSWIENGCPPWRMYAIG